MDTSLAHENARLRALLQTQQDTIRQMAEYNCLLSQRVAAYASEINRLKALVAKLQRMQFGKSSEKLRAKTERQIQEAQERISALQEEMAETLGEQFDPVLPSALRQSSARKPLPASLPRETRVIRPEEECCPACGGELSSLGCDVSEQLELISSAFKVIETQRPKLACCRCDHIVQAPVSSKPIARSYAGAGLLAHVVTGKYADHLPLYRQSEIYRRQGVEVSRTTLGLQMVFLVSFSPQAFLRCYPVPLLRGKPCKAVADDAQKNPGIMAGICELSHYFLIPKRNISVGNKGCIITSSLKMNNLGDKAVTS